MLAIQAICTINPPKPNLPQRFIRRAVLLDVRKHIVSFRNYFAAFYLLMTVTAVYIN